MKHVMRALLIHSLLIFIQLLVVETHAACGANTRLWQADAGSSRWDTKNNWNPRNFPNGRTENALIQSDWFFPQYPNRNYTLGCLEIVSGNLTASVNRTLTITGDYFRSPYKNSLIISSNRWEVFMAGTGPQEFTNLDPIPRLRLGNVTTTDIYGDFNISNRFKIDAGTGRVNIYGTLQVDAGASDLTIPSSATVIVKSGQILRILSNLTVDGVLKVEPGAILEIGNGSTLTVNSGGILELSGVSGNIAKVQANNGGRYSLNIAGNLNAEYFSISGTNSAGLNLTGTVQRLENGDFQGIATNGYAITLGASASLPPTLLNLGFFDQGATGTQRNINASNFNVSNISFTNWSGLGGASNETDPNNRLDWGVAGTPTLQVIDRSGVGEPPTTINTGTVDQQFMTLGFSMTGIAANSTDITSITFTVGGIYNAADISNMKVFKDVNGNCAYNAGTDTQLGTTLIPTGSPAQATLNIGAGEISVIDTNEKCIFVFYTISNSAQNGNTISVKISATNDIENSQGYDWSTSGAPPLEGGQSTINGSQGRIWHGGNGNPTSGGTYSQNNNWLPNGFPTATTDCQIGPGYSFPVFPNNTERPCLNATLPSNGEMSWANRTTTFAVYGSLSIGSNYNFIQAANGTIAFRGTDNQSISAQTAWPGNVLAANTGGANISVNSNWTIQGNLTIDSGEFTVGAGTTLTVLGNININAGKLSIAPSGTLVMGNGSTITVGAPGTISILGSNGQTANITTASNTQDWSMVVNGTISAKYYSFSNLGTTGVTVNSAATIDTINHFQNGAFSYPVNNSTALLTLNRQIPGNEISNITFDSAGSASTGITNIATNTGAGTLTLSNWNGNLGGENFDNDPTYVVTWGTQTNTINLSAGQTTSGNINQGQTYNMGRFNFNQTQAGTFNDTNITSLSFTLLGTANSSDVSQIRAYYETDCNSTGGTLIGAASFSGVPATATITGITGATIPSHLTLPPNVCIYVELDVAALATSGSTIGISIESSTDVINSEGYMFNAAAAPAVSLGPPRTIQGTSTVWTGANSTAWNNAGNWAGGIPNSNLNCIINNSANNPLINGITANCKSLTIGNGTLSMTGGAVLNIYGSFSNTGSFNQNGQTFNLSDNGATATIQTLDTTIPIESITFNKTAGGKVLIGTGILEVTNTLNTGTSNSFRFEVQSSKTLKLTSGATISSGELAAVGTGRIQIGNGQTLSVTGGKFTLDGTLEVLPEVGTPPSSYYASYTTSKAILEPISGSFGFNATSGTVSLDGFVIKGLDQNGLRINGSTSLLKMDGGQITGLPTNYASVTAMEFSTTGSLPTAATKIGINWETNLTDEANTPATTDAYTLIKSTGCGGQTMDITEWSGDWFEETDTFDITSKVNLTNCNINFGASVSAVSLLSFTATPYNNRVQLNWQTLFETDHNGFNVYRSDIEGNNFLQINTELIRNNLSSVSYKGKYSFLDEDANNGETYLYYIEDVDRFGNTKLHGPRSAQPLAELGAPPSLDPDVNDGGTNIDNGNGNVADPGTISNPSYKDLGDGVQVLSQTSTNLRLRIAPAAPTFTTSTWDSLYKEVSIPSYSKTQDAGKPELLQRVLLIEINPFATSASLISISKDESFIPGNKIQPAPNFILNSSNILVPSYQIDSDFYSTNQALPSNYINVATDLISISGKKFLKVTVAPLKYNPVSKILNKLDQAILDISIDGNSWDIEPPTNPTNFNANLIANTLRIDFSQKGMIQVTYDDLVSSSTEGPFVGALIDDLRLYKGSIEVPIHISSADSIFNSGDAIYFYGDFEKTIDDTKNQRVLSNQNIYNSSTPPLRFSTINGALNTTRVSSNINSPYYKLEEQNNDVLLYESLGDGQDHFFWKTLRAINNPAHELTINTSLPNLDPDHSDDEVTMKLTLKSWEIVEGDTEYDNHVAIYINGNVNPDHEVIFSEKSIQTLEFTLPHSLFQAGNNTVRIRAMGTYASPVSVLETIAFDKMELFYHGRKNAINNRIELENYDPNSVVTIGNFTNSMIELWDITDLSNPGLVIDGTIYSNDGNATFNLDFQANDNTQELGLKYYAVTAGNYIKPTGLSLSLGYQIPLKSNENQADLLIIGSQFLLDRTSELVSQRQSQGLEVKTVSMDQIYSEFSDGKISTEAIKEFVNYTLSNWTPPYPKYLLILGDGNYDPKDNLEFSGMLKGDTPMRLEGGRFIDFATDHYFVTSDSSNLPQLAVGRIPTNDPIALENYIEKLLLYENGTSLPSNGLLKLSFIAGKEEEVADNFEGRISRLTSISSRFSKNVLNWKDFGSDLQTKTEVLNQFTTETPFMMTYMGHGAPNQWGSINFIKNDDMDSLNNEKLPIIMSLNCENSLFYDPERENYTRTIGEASILNPQGGAIAFIGSSTQSTPAAQIYFAEAFYGKLVEETNQTYHRVTIGEILQEAKLTLGTDTYSKDIMKSTMLFGDPSMPLPQELFPEEPPTPVTFTPPSENDSKKGGILGCSLAASEDNNNPNNWFSGILELLFLIGFARFLRKVALKN